MTGDRFVRTPAIRAAVRGHETDILAALGIKLNGRSHIRCPFPDHDDENPSWRWDIPKAMAHCSCLNGHACSIFDVIGRLEGVDFDAAKIRAAELLGRSDLIEEKGAGGTKMSAAYLLEPPADRSAPTVPLRYLAHRIGVTLEKAPAPATSVAGWLDLEYWDPPAQSEGKHVLVGKHPCAVFGTVAPDGRTHAHRIYVAPMGRGKADLAGRDPKKSAPGKAAGCAVIFGDRDRAPWLLLAEGIETAAAIALAFRSEIEAGEAYVAAAISEAGVGGFDPWPATKRVTVCADRDEAKRDRGYKAGEKAARRFAERHQGKLEVMIALAGLPGGKVDWLDVRDRSGIDAVRKGIAAGEKPALAPDDQPKESKAAPGPSRKYSLAEVHKVFRAWLGAEYDLDTLNAVLAAAAAEKLPGDPLWLLVISGPGNAKTETVQSLGGAGAHITSTIASEGALLSATSKKGVVKDATGGLLRKIGERGLLVIKDITSILSANRDTRAAVLAALREVYDGRWERNVGTDGGRTLTWQGRIIVVGAVTTAWDTAHSVIATMGDRFVLVRADSHSGRIMAGRRAMKNTGSEAAMRAAMIDAVGGLIEAVDHGQAVEQLTEDEEERILQAANLVTLARTGVEFDYRGDVIDAHQPEMPTRFAKQLVQMFRGAVALGLDRPSALALVIRCARDSMPPLRLELLRDVASHHGARVIDIRRRVGKPRATVDRQLQALHILGLLTCHEDEEMRAGKTVCVRHYSLEPEFDLAVLTIPDLSVGAGIGVKKESEREGEEGGADRVHSTGTDISGIGRQHVGRCDHCGADVFADNMRRTESGALLHFPCVELWSRGR